MQNQRIREVLNQFLSSKPFESNPDPMASKWKSILKDGKKNMEIRK
jgi:hypothetical protein